MPHDKPRTTRTGAGRNSRAYPECPPALLAGNIPTHLAATCCLLPSPTPFLLPVGVSTGHTAHGFSPAVRSGLGELAGERRRYALPSSVDVSGNQL
ncbi:hypothetical protein ABZP36_000800 [Zizania latifolia]